MKINDYTAVSATKNKGLGPIVKAYLDLGWQPYYGPYLDRNGVERQAMVMYEENQYPVMAELKPEQIHKPKPKKGAKKNED